MTLPDVFYGACGNEGCTDCRPLFADDNQPIPGPQPDRWLGFQPGVGDPMPKKEEQ